MKKETLLVAFSTQKGGAGKTTLTVLMASYLYYVKGMDVAVIDCDYPQYSIKDMRERDMRNIERNAHLRKTAFEQFARLKKKMYPIVESRPEKAVEKAKDFLVMETPPDIIFFDLPGTVNNSDVINTVATMDYVFCPIMADRVVAESSLNFATVVNDTLLSTGRSNIKGLYLLWNMVDGREKTDLYDRYEKVAGELGLNVMRTFLPDSKRFRRESAEDGERSVFRSTVMPPDRSLIRGSNIERLANEMLELINA